MYFLFKIKIRNGRIPPSSQKRPLITNDPKPRISLLNCLLGMIAIASLYVAPMYLVGHWYLYAVICGAAGLTAIAALKFTWFDKLEEDCG